MSLTVQAGKPIRLQGTFRDFDGVLTDPTASELTIYCPDGSEITNLSPLVQLSTGIWYYVYTTPLKIPKMDYVFEVKGTVDGVVDLARGTFSTVFVA